MEEQTEAVKSDLEKLKESNDTFEKELIRSRELQAERQKIEAERMLASSAGKQIPTLTPEETAQAKSKALADEITSAFK